MEVSKESAGQVTSHVTVGHCYGFGSSGQRRYLQSAAPGARARVLHAGPPIPGDGHLRTRDVHHRGARPSGLLSWQITTRRQDYRHSTYKGAGRRTWGIIAPHRTGCYGRSGRAHLYLHGTAVSPASEFIRQAMNLLSTCCSTCKDGAEMSLLGRCWKRALYSNHQSRAVILPPYGTYLHTVHHFFGKAIWIQDVVDLY